MNATPRSRRFGFVAKAFLLVATGLSLGVDVTQPRIEFESVDASRPIDMLRAERADDARGDVTYRGAALRVRVAGELHVWRGAREIPPRAEVIELRAGDRLRAFAEPRTSSDAALESVPSRGQQPVRVSFVIHDGSVHDEQDTDASARGACPYTPREADDDFSTFHPDPSRVTFRFSRPPSSDSCGIELRVIGRDGTQRHAVRAPCEGTSGLASTSVRIVADTRGVFPESRERALVASLGDVVEASLVPTNGDVRARVEVGAPLGPCATRRVRLAIHVVRAEVDALSPAGTTHAAIHANLDAIMAHTRSAYAACGIEPVAELDASIHDAPPPFVLSVAEGDGLPARGGGEIRFRANGHEIGPIPTTARATPAETAASIATALRHAGLVPTVVVPPRIDRAVHAAADVLVRDARGELAQLSADPDVPLSTDARQTVRIGHVDFADGLDEFDLDRSRAGTLEERTLIHALRDDDAQTIDVFFIERFSDGVRQGEAFVPRDGGPLAASVLLDRRGLFHEPSTYTLAHELGHVLLDDPFHPDASPAAPFPRVMGSDSGRRDVSVVRVFTAQECDRMRFAGDAFLAP